MLYNIIYIAYIKLLYILIAFSYFYTIITNFKSLKKLFNALLIILGPRELRR
jgi:hypothetical protein